MISSGAEPEREMARLRAENAILFEANQACFLVAEPRTGVIQRVNGHVDSNLGSSLKIGVTRLHELFLEGDGDRIDDALAEVAQFPNHRRVVNEAHIRPPNGLPLPVDLAIVGFGEGLVLIEVSHCPITGSASGPEPLLDKSGDVTAKVFHDVRNLLFPLVGQVELAMASIEPESSAYAPLLEVIAACRRCESTLTQIEAITVAPNTAPSILYTADLFERLRLVLRYSVSRNLDFDLQIAEDTPPIRPPRSDFQRALATLVTLILNERDAQSQVVLSARPIETQRVHYEFTIRSESPVATQCLGPAVAVLADELGVSLAENSEEVVLQLDLEGRAAPQHPSPETLGNGETVLVMHARPMPRDVLRGYLRACGFEVETFDRSEALQARLVESPVSAVVADLEALPAAEVEDLKSRFRVPVLSAAAQMQDLGRRIRSVLDQTPED